jgi:hypothetical protein
MLILPLDYIVSASPELAFASQLAGYLVEAFSPDKLEWVGRRVQRSAPIWTARWTNSHHDGASFSSLLGASDRDLLIIIPTMALFARWPPSTLRRRDLREHSSFELSGVRRASQKEKRNC